MKHVIRAITVVIAITILALANLTPAGASPGQPVPPPSADPASDHASELLDDVDPTAVAALAQERGIPADAAREQLAREKALSEQGDRLEQVLHGRSGGSYLDDDGRLVVTTLDAGADASVRGAGARPERVDDSTARLEAIMDRLNKHAERKGAGNIQSWHVDVPENTVVITVTEGAVDPQTTAMLKVAEAFGASVRVETAPADQAPQTTALLSGGFAYRTPTGGTCSIGFNTRDAYNRDVVLTAGHCVTSTGYFSRAGYIIGKGRTSNFPVDDFGTFWNSYPGYWNAKPWVYGYNGYHARIVGSWNSPGIGTTVCKSGRTTGYNCGKIRALNKTVNYGQGRYVYGLVQHTACVERGDSGGANISVSRYALGLTSGAALINGKCRSKYGYTNISYYQPVAEALSRNGLRLVL